MGKLIRPQVTIEEAVKEPHKWIPNGIYCYIWNNDGNVFTRTGYLCPFWDSNNNEPYMSNGYCHYLKIGDWDSKGMSLLWDMCKECEINNDD